MIYNRYRGLIFNISGFYVTYIGLTNYSGSSHPTHIFGLDNNQDYMIKHRRFIIRNTKGVNICKNSFKHNRTFHTDTEGIFQGYYGTNKAQRV